MQWSSAVAIYKLGAFWDTAFACTRALPPQLDGGVAVNLPYMIAICTTATGGLLDAMNRAGDQGAPVPTLKFVTQKSRLQFLRLWACDGFGDDLTLLRVISPSIARCDIPMVRMW